MGTRFSVSPLPSWCESGKVSHSADGIEGSELRFFALSQLPDELVPIHKPTIEDYKSYQGKFLLR